MNIFTAIILGTLILDYLLNLTSELLNLKALDKRIPEEFQNHFDRETYTRSQEYTRATTRFGLINTTFSLMILILFWFAGGFNWLDQIVRDWNYGVVGSGLLYIGALILFKTVASLPFSLYSTFVIEERFGFNKTTPALFIADLLKGLAVGVLLGGPLLAGIIAFFEFGGPRAWLWAWIAVTLYMLFVQYIAPTWIMPLFNKFEPMEDDDLRQAIRDYAAKVRFPLQEIYVMDGSKRSGKSNAFFTGFGKNRRIVLFDTLIEQHSHEELIAVLAHEIGHYKKRHIPKNLVISTLHKGVMFGLLSLFLQIPGLFDAFFMEEMSVYAGLVFFGLLYAPVEMILSAGMRILSRRHEFEADAFASETTGNPEAMAEVLKKLAKNNLSNLTPHPFYAWLNYSHPPLLQRIRAIRKVRQSSAPARSA